MPPWATSVANEPLPPFDPFPRGDLNRLAIINAALEVLNARLLAILALLGAIAMFGYVVVRPEEWRLYATAVYAAGVLWPMVYLYMKKG